MIHENYSGWIQDGGHKVRQIIVSKTIIYVNCEKNYCHICHRYIYHDKEPAKEMEFLQVWTTFDSKSMFLEFPVKPISLCQTSSKGLVYVDIQEPLRKINNLTTTYKCFFFKQLAYKLSKKREN